jgi:hypothetical protein
MSHFQWDGDVYPMPQGWHGLSVEDWFYRLETVRDRIMKADEENLEPMYDEDGDPIDPEEVLLIRVFGFQDGGHWEAFRSWGVASWAAQMGEDPTNLEFRMSGIVREQIMREKAGAMTGLGGGGGGLDPVEGVTLDQWAYVQAAVAGGGNVDQLIAQAGIDRPRWDRVSAMWMQRMSTDTTAAIATAYGNAFAAASQGQYGAVGAHAAAVGVGGDLGAEPIPFERYVEIEQAMGAYTDRGHDPNAVLAHFGLSVLDWSNIGLYWNKRVQQEAMTYAELYDHYSELYRAKYAG